jgi:hypothetical protein
MTEEIGKLRIRLALQRRSRLAPRYAWMVDDLRQRAAAGGGDER